MRKLLIVALTANMLMSGCSTSPVDQVRELQASTRCCIEASVLSSIAITTGGPVDGVLDRSTSLISHGQARAPALAYRLPTGSAGSIVEITAYPDMGAVTKARSLIFAPVAMAFLDDTGKYIPGTEQTDFLPASGGSMYLFLVTRQAKIPPTAATLVVISDPKEYGAQQHLKHQTTSYLMPVAGIFVPMGGGDSVTAIWSPYGKFKVALRR